MAGTVTAADSESIRPIPRPDAAALRMTVEWEDVFIDGYRDVQVRVKGENFELWAPTSPSWHWQASGPGETIVRHRSRQGFAFGIQVFPLTAYDENPRTPRAMAGYLEWIRRGWERGAGRRFVLLENSLPVAAEVDEDSLLPVSAERHRTLWEHGSERIRYALLAADSDEPMHHTEWWVEASFLRARIHFASPAETHGQLRGLVMDYLREMRLFAELTPAMEGQLDQLEAER